MILRRDIASSEVGTPSPNARVFASGAGLASTCVVWRASRLPSGRYAIEQPRPAIDIDGEAAFGALADDERIVQPHCVPQVLADVVEAMQHLQHAALGDRIDRVRQILARRLSSHLPVATHASSR